MKRSPNRCSRSDGNWLEEGPLGPSSLSGVEWAPGERSRLAAYCLSRFANCPVYRTASSLLAAGKVSVKTLSSPVWR